MSVRGTAWTILWLLGSAGVLLADVAMRPPMALGELLATILWSFIVIGVVVLIAAFLTRSN